MVQWIVTGGILLGGGVGLLGVADDTSGRTLPTAWPELRIDSQLFVNGRKQRVEPRSLFDDGKVYDYLNGPGEVTIFEPVEKRFTLYHRSKSVACWVSFFQIEQHLEQLRNEAMDAVKEAEESPLAGLVRWRWEPSFQEIFDPQIGQLKLKSAYVTYTINGIAMERLQGAARGLGGDGSENVAAALRSYWDWYARLNARLNPRALPPAARLAVNARLVEYRLVPEELLMQLHFGQRTTVRTTHQTTLGLKSEDRRRLDETRRGLKEARMVSLEDYLRETGEGLR
jgi:hypothetical protein